MIERDAVQLSWVASFVAVVEHGGFTAAARALARSQPRVSAHVAALEKALGAALLDRTSKGVRLTAAGTEFLPHAKSTLGRLRDGVDAVSAVATRLQGRVRVGSYPGAAAVLIAPLMRQFRSVHGGVALDLSEAEPMALEDLVADGSVDFAIRTADVPQRHHDVPSRPLFQEKIVLVTPAGHRMAAATGGDLRALTEETVVVTGDPLTGWTDYRERLDSLGVEPRQVITVAQPTTLAALVRAGIGVGLLGALAASITCSTDDLATIELPAPVWLRGIRLYERARQVDPPALEAFLDLLLREAPRLTAGLAVW